MYSVTDSEGTNWSFRITCGTVMRFEKLSGVGLLAEISELLKQYNTFAEIELSAPVVVEALSSIFKGEATKLLMLAYASAGKTDVPFEEFVDRFEGEKISELLTAVGGAFGDFFQKVLPKEKASNEESEKDGPGSTSTK